MPRSSCLVVWCMIPEASSGLRLAAASRVQSSRRLLLCPGSFWSFVLLALMSGPAKKQIHTFSFFFFSDTSYLPVRMIFPNMKQCETMRNMYSIFCWMYHSVLPKCCWGIWYDADTEYCNHEQLPRAEDQDCSYSLFLCILLKHAMFVLSWMMPWNIDRPWQVCHGNCSEHSPRGWLDSPLA